MYLPKNLGKGGMFVEIYLNWRNEATTITMDVNLFISKFSNYAKNMHKVTSFTDFEFGEVVTNVVKKKVHCQDIKQQLKHTNMVKQTQRNSPHFSVTL